MTTAKKPVAKKPKPRLSDSLPVYFAARTGHLPIVSDDHKVVDHRGTKEKIPGLHLTFGDTGVTRAYDPHDPEDAAFIARVRKWLSDGRDERIRAFNVREIRNSKDQPSPPTTMWDATNAKGVAKVAESGAIDVRLAILYEEQNQNRQDVLDVLHEALEARPAGVAAEGTPVL